jgi:hypothetical protein
MPRKSIYSPPDSFSLAPFLALLPVCGDIGKLEELTSSLYARYEKVANQEHAESGRARAAEAAMLKQVLDWLEVHPDHEPGADE